MSSNPHFKKAKAATSLLPYVHVYVGVGDTETDVQMWTKLATDGARRCRPELRRRAHGRSAARDDGRRRLPGDRRPHPDYPATTIRRRTTRSPMTRPPITRDRLRRLRPGSRVRRRRSATTRRSRYTRRLLKKKKRRRSRRRRQAECRPSNGRRSRGRAAATRGRQAAGPGRPDEPFTVRVPPVATGRSRAQARGRNEGDLHQQ